MRLISNLTLFIVAAVSVAAQDGAPAGSHPAGDEPTSIAIPAGGQTTVPMELYGRKPVVEAKINGKGPFRFFLDTGAGATVLNQDLASELKLPTEGTVKIGDPANPQAIEAPRNRVKTLEIGGVKISNFIAVSFDRSVLYQPGSPRGVLGMPLFRKLLLTIDYPKAQVVIDKGSLPSADGKTVLNFESGEAGLFRLPLIVAGKPLGATIDSGSQSSISFPESFKETLPLIGPPVEIGRGRTVAGEAIIYGSKLKGDITFGEYKLTEPEIRFFGRLTNPNLGYEFLRPYAMTIDQVNKRIRFEKGVEKAKQANPAWNAYVGNYGPRRVFIENGDLLLQRISGPQGEGPKMKIVAVNKDEFALEGTKDVRFKFVRSAEGNAAELNVLTPQGQWESAKRNP